MGLGEGQATPCSANFRTAVGMASACCFVGPRMSRLRSHDEHETIHFHAVKASALQNSPNARSHRPMLSCSAHRSKVKPQHLQWDNSYTHIAGRPLLSESCGGSADSLVIRRWRRTP